MKILYGTTNEAKVMYMKERLADDQLQVISLRDVDDSIRPQVEESGNSPLDNAIIKAKAYYEAYRMPVFSCDSGLYIDGLEKEKQPGVYIRRVKDKTLTDDEMIDYYGKLITSLGGQAKARYRNAICFIIDENNIYTYDGDSIASRPFILSNKVHKKRIEGFPLDSLSIDPETGKYYYDQEPKPSTIDGFSTFFNRALVNYHMKHFD